ncbi:MAG: AAA family ATPase [Planctomycetaceae bacterium]|nr:AAA family ATPase [Planctomycetaceae bacterium]MCA9046282.1 AAA family ATPase [Planctomycetaceae bacterium]
MFSKLEIVGYRGFEKFSIPKLGRINLLVGRNNCGKTSILEAVQLPLSIGRLEVMAEIAMRRGETLNSPQSRVSANHFFHGHEIRGDRNICVSLDEAHIRMELDPLEVNRQRTLFGRDDEAMIPIWGLHCSWNDIDETEYILPILDDGDIDVRKYIRSHLNASPKNTEAFPVAFLPTSGLSVRDMTQMFDSIVLTPAEDYVNLALQTIDPRVRRVASLGKRSSHASDSRGGFVVKLEDVQDRVPIGSLGDGIWRIFGLAVSMSSLSSGVLLIDEIDTGLHYTTMEKMWRLIDETSKRLNVQVFATTHSRDCYESLASICRDDVMEDGSEIMVHRIEQGRETAVTFFEGEIISASLHDTEVR